MVEQLLRADLSPEQVSGLLRLLGVLHISVQTIYTHIWADKQHGGDLHRHLRQRHRYRKRYGGGAERRGRLEGKRHISERPAEINQRTEIGHWEGDTMVSTRSKHCLLTLVERLFYFATPYHAWERGSNENTNGLIRQYLPKGHDLKPISQTRCTEIASTLNNRPRKRFGFLTPIQQLRSYLDHR